MRTAIITTDGRLGAPTVGVWHPVSSGPQMAVGSGALLGTILKNGQAMQVCVPTGSASVWRALVRPGAWVSYGMALVSPVTELGESVGVTAVDQRDLSLPDGYVAVRAETDGTLYLRPDPNSAAFVTLDGNVEAKTILALIEVMKTFSPVRAPKNGTVRRILAVDGASVEAGDVLFWLG